MPDYAAINERLMSIQQNIHAKYLIIMTALDVPPVSPFLFR